MDPRFCAVLFFAALSSSYASFVYDLNTQNFDQLVREKDVMLVDFFAPWCHHCQALSPEYESAANALAAKGLYEFAKVDCNEDSNKPLCDKYHVQGFPSVKLFKLGKYAGDYIGERTGPALVNYMESVTSSSAQNAPLTVGSQNNQPMAFNQPQPFAPPPQPQVAQPQVPGLMQPFAPQPPAPMQGFNPYMNINNAFQNPATATVPSLMHAFYNAPQQQAPAVSAFASQQAPADEAGPKVSASPDSLEGKFGGNILALEILRSKLKMIAAYKNWQRRLKEYKEKMVEAATGTRYGETKTAIAKKPSQKAAAKSKLAKYKPAPTHFAQKYPRVLTPAQKHAKEMAEYRRRAAAYKKAVAFRRQQIITRQKQERKEKEREQQDEYSRSQIRRPAALVPFQQPLYQVPQARSMIPQPQIQAFQAPQAQIQQPQIQAFQAPQAQIRAQVPPASQAQIQAQAPSQAQIQTQAPSQESVIINMKPNPQPELVKQQTETQEDQSAKEADKAPKNDDSPSIKDLRADIESAIKDALKNGDKTTDTDAEKNSGAGAKEKTADESKAQDPAGSGSGALTSSPVPNTSAHAADVSGSGSKEAESGSGSGEAGTLIDRIRRMAGEA